METTQKLDLDKVMVNNVTNIDMSDAPDFVDAMIDSAEIDGRELTEDELDEVNENQEFVYDATIDQLY